MTEIPSLAVTLLIKWTPGGPAIPRDWPGCTDPSQGEEAGAQIRTREALVRQQLTHRTA